MDIFDRAQEMDAEFRTMSIDAVTRLAAQQNYDANHAVTDCAWCGKEIPEARRRAVPGCDLCAKCQSKKERLPGRKR